MLVDKKVVIPAEVMARQVGDETVILHLGSGSYFGLDPVGARIWDLIGQGKSLAAIRDVLHDEYEADLAQLEQDLHRLVQELLAKGLVAEA